jgi:hypothetical protein
MKSFKSNKNNKVCVLSLNLGDESFSLYRIKRLVDGKGSLPCEDHYQIEFNTDYQGSIKDLSLPAALIMIINMLCGIGERATHKSGEYAYTKDQIMAMASIYSQSDSLDLIDFMNEIHDLEFEAMQTASSND